MAQNQAPAACAAEPGCTAAQATVRVPHALSVHRMRCRMNHCTAEVMPGHGKLSRKPNQAGRHLLTPCLHGPSVALPSPWMVGRVPLHHETAARLLEPAQHLHGRSIACRESAAAPQHAFGLSGTSLAGLKVQVLSSFRGLLPLASLWLELSGIQNVPPCGIAALLDFSVQPAVPACRGHSFDLGMSQPLLGLHISDPHVLLALAALRLWTPPRHQPLLALCKLGHTTA